MRESKDKDRYKVCLSSNNAAKLSWEMDAQMICNVQQDVNLRRQKGPRWPTEGHEVEIPVQVQ